MLLLTTLFILFTNTALNRLGCGMLKVVKVKMRRFHNMELASLPKTGAVTQGVIKGHVKIHRTTVDFVSICYVCKASAVHSNDFSNRQQLSQAENALLIFDYY